MRAAYGSTPHPSAFSSAPKRPDRGVHHYLPLPPLSLRDPAPQLRQPHLLTTYSHLPDRTVVPGDASMAYYSPCPIGSDLNYGFDRRVERKEDEEEHLDGICGALRREWEKGRQGEREGGIITWRGMITRIMTAPYDNDGWEMTAIPLAGSVYIELHDPPDVRSARSRKQSAWAMQSYMGMAFESYSTKSTNQAEEGSLDVDGEDRPEGWSGDVNTNVQWCNVVRSAIGEIPLCLGGEVDCVKREVGSPHPGLEGCLELKTNKVIENEKQEGIFHRKMLKHWAQSWLLGIPEVEVGFRDEAGIIRSLRSFETMSIPRFISSLPNPPWHPSPPLHFLHKTLSMVLHHVLPTDLTPIGGLREGDELPPAVVWRFSFVPRRGCELWFVGEEGIGENGRWGGVFEEDYVRWRMSRHS